MTTPFYPIILMVLLNEVSWSNSNYIYTSNNGSINLEQYPTISSVVQYASACVYDSSNAYSLLYGDSNSNVSISYSNYTSNTSLYVSLNNNLIYSTMTAPYFNTSNTSNTLQLSMFDDMFSLFVNGSNLLKVQSYSTQIPKDYDEYSSINIFGLSNGMVSSIVYQPNAIIETPAIFKQPIQATSIACSNTLQVGKTYKINEYNSAPADRWFKLGILNSNANTQSLIMYDIDASRVDNHSFYPYIAFSPRAYNYESRFNFSQKGNTNGVVSVYSNSNNHYEIWVKCESYTFFRGDIVFEGSALDIQPSLNDTWVSAPPSNLTFQYSTASNNPHIHTEMDNGNIGIGKTNGTYKLDINGTTNSTEYREGGVQLATKYALSNSQSNYTLLTSHNAFSNYITPTAEWGSNNFINFQLATTAESQYSYLSNISTFASNVSVWTNHALQDYTPLSNFTQLSNYTYNYSPDNSVAVWGSNASYFSSNTSVFGSNLAVFGSNTAVFGSNTAVFGSNLAVFGSNLAVFGSNKAVFGSNTAVYSSNNLIKKSGDSGISSLIMNSGASLWIGNNGTDTGARMRVLNTGGNSYIDYWSNLYVRCGSNVSIPYFTFTSNGILNSTNSYQENGVSLTTKYALSNTLSNFALNNSLSNYALSTTAVWSSNNLFNKNENVALASNKILSVGKVNRINEYNSSGTDKWFKLGVMSSNANNQALHMFNIDGSRADGNTFYPYIGFSPRAYSYEARFNYSIQGDKNAVVNVYANSNAQYEIWVFCQSFTNFRGDITFDGTFIDLQPTLNDTWVSAPSSNLTFQYSTASNQPFWNVEMNTGNVAIGKSNATYRLDVAGTMRASNYVLPNDAWITSAEGRFRLYCMSNGRTYYGAYNGHEWRNQYDANIMNLSDTGNLAIGLSSTTQKVDVAGNIRTSSNFLISSQYNIGSNHSLYEKFYNVAGSNYTGYLTLDNQGVATNLSIQGKPVLSVFDNMVGVGDYEMPTWTPSAVLSTYSISNQENQGFHFLSETKYPSDISLGFRQNGTDNTGSNTDQTYIGQRTMAITSLSNTADLVFRKAFSPSFSNFSANIMKLSYNNCEVNINSNLSIGNIANSSNKVSICGDYGSVLTGPHVGHYISGDDHPIHQTLAWSPNNIAINFSSFYDGNWKSATANKHAYQIYNISDTLQFNWGSNGVGSNITWSPSLQLSSNNFVDTAILYTRGRDFNDSNNATNVPTQSQYGDATTRILLRRATLTNDYPSQIGCGTIGTMYGVGATQRHRFFAGCNILADYQYTGGEALNQMLGKNILTKLAVGANQTYQNAIWNTDVVVGTSSTQSKSTIVNLPFTISGSYQVHMTHKQITTNLADAFVSKISAMSSSNFTIITTRLDNTSWGTSLSIMCQVVGYE